MISERPRLSKVTVLSCFALENISHRVVSISPRILLTGISCLSFLSFIWLLYSRDRLPIRAHLVRKKASRPRQSSVSSSFSHSLSPSLFLSLSFSSSPFSSRLSPCISPTFLCSSLFPVGVNIVLFFILNVVNFLVKRTN